MINCDRCGGPTRPKQIFSRKKNQTFDLLECTGGCRSGKYSYTFFPPQEAQVPVIQTEEPKQGNGKATLILEMILLELKSMNQYLAKQSGQIHISKQELEPDQDTPF